MKNLFLLTKQKSVGKSKRRQSQFVEQFELDFNKLRNKFSRDEELKNKLI